eukprot:jgi/Ulvmu1/7299/UM035_0088.1
MEHKIGFVLWRSLWHGRHLSMQVLGLAYRCVVICSHHSNYNLACAIATELQSLYHTLLCALRTPYKMQSQHFENWCGSQEDASAPGATPPCDAANTDEHAVAVVLPTVHTAIFLIDPKDDRDDSGHRLMAIASKCGCQVVVVRQACAKSKDESKPAGHAANDTDTDNSPLTGQKMGLCISASVQSNGSTDLSHRQRREMHSLIGVPDVALTCFTDDHLRSILTRRGPTPVPGSSLSRAVIDLAAFSELKLPSVALVSGKALDPAVCNIATSTGPKDVAKPRSPADVASCLDLACMLLHTNQLMQKLDLSGVSVGVHGAKSLAAVLSGSNISQLILKVVPLPIASLLGRTASRSKSEVDGIELLGSKLILEDVVLLTELFSCGAVHQSIHTVLIRGDLAVPNSVVDGFASAVASVKHIFSIQGIPKHHMEGLKGNVSLVRWQSHNFDTTDACVGAFGVLVAAKILLRSISQMTADTRMHQHQSENTEDGPLHNDKTMWQLSSADLSGSYGGPYANAKIAAAIACRGAASQLGLNLACTMPGIEGCQAWAHAINSRLGSSLTSLNLSSNCITEESMEHLAPMFGACSRATHAAGCTTYCTAKNVLYKHSSIYSVTGICGPSCILQCWKQCPILCWIITIE